MFKLEIEYTDYNGNDVKENVFFHFTQDEMFAFIRENRDVLKGEMSKAVSEQDWLLAYNFIRKLVLESYGEKSEDGLRFVKNDDTRLNLIETPRMDAIVDKVFGDEKTAQTFVRSIIPPKMVELLDQREGASNN